MDTPEVERTTSLEPVASTTQTTEKAKGPEPCGFRACCEQCLEGERLGASFSRIQGTLVSIKAIARLMGSVQGPVQGPCCARRHEHRNDQWAERNQPLQGLGGSNDMARFHGEILWVEGWLRRADFSMGADCKDSLLSSSTPCDNGGWLRCNAYTPVSNTTLTRRQNALALFQDYAEKALAAGATPKGLEQAFAATLQISPSMWSQIKSSRPVGDKLARQIESACGKPAGWLDTPRKDAAPSAAETAFVELALAAWRSANSAGRKALRDHLKRVVAS